MQSSEEKQNNLPDPCHLGLGFVAVHVGKVVELICLPTYEVNSIENES